MNSPEPSAPLSVIWIERLTAPGSLGLALRALSSGASIRFDEHQATRAARALAWRFERVLGPGRFSPALLVLNVVDGSGEGLVYRRCENLSGAISGFCARALPGASGRERRMTECFLATELLQRAGFLTMVERAAASYPGARHEAWVRGHFLNRALVDHFAAAGLPVREAGCGAQGLRFALIPAALAAKSAWRGLFGAAPEAAARPAVWIEKAPQGAVWDGFERSASRFAKAASRAYDIVYYFDRADTPCDEATTRRLASAGLGCEPLFDVTARARLGLRELAGVWARAWASAPRGAWWLPFLWVHAALLRALHADVFRARGVKVLIQHQETSWKQEPKARAIEDAGGVMLGLHWSNYEHHDFPSHLVPQHAFFVWGASHRDYLEKRDYEGVVLPSGVWIAPVEGEADRPAFSPGVRRKAAVFDSDAYYDLYMSPESLARFYAWLADVLERRPEIGVIFKPKAIRPGATGLEALGALGGAALAARYDRLLAQGRLVVLDGGVYTPVDAACRADFAVSFGLNTAGFLAGLAGKPSVQWDCTGWMRHPLYAVAGQQVLFTSLEAAGAAFERACAGDASAGGLGAYGRRLNHFGDFGGAARIFGFIDDCMKRLTAGEPRALEESAKRYLAEHSVEGF